MEPWLSNKQTNKQIKIKSNNPKLQLSTTIPHHFFPSSLSPVSLFLGEKKKETGLGKQ